MTHHITHRRSGLKSVLLIFVALTTKPILESARVFAFLLLASTPVLAQSVSQWAGVQAGENNSYDIPWLGKVWEAQAEGWVWHENLGWIYAVGNSPESVHIFKHGLGWLWISKDCNHTFYSWNLDGWIWHSPNTSNPQVFYDYNGQRWVEDYMNGEEPLDVTPALAYITEQTTLPAMALAVVKHGKIVAHGQFGKLNKTTSGNVDSTSTWSIGSINKSMTCVLAGCMVEDGLLDWDDTISELLPSESITPSLASATLSDLLHHTSGLDDDDVSSAIARSTSPIVSSSLSEMENRSRLTSFILALEPTYAPGSRYEYSNIAYTIAGHILENIGGKTYETLLRERVFEPLGLKNAAFGLPASAQGNQPWGHVRGVPCAPDNYDIQPLPCLNPSGGARMTIDDLALYAAAHLAGQKGKCYLLTPATWDTLHYSCGDASNNYSYGWFVDDAVGDALPTFKHFGNVLTFSSVAILDPENDFAVVAATNEGDETLAMDPLLSAIMSTLNHLGYPTDAVQ